MVTNGDFSSNAAGFTAYPGYSGQSGNPAITGWVGQLLFGVNGAGTGSTVQNIFGPTSLANLTGAKDFAFLQNSASTVRATLTQTITLTQGQLYTLSFEAAARGDSGGYTYTLPTGSVSIGTAAVTVNSLNDLSKAGFTSYTTTFTATTAISTLTITNTGPSGATGDDDTFDISDLSITPVVPEPATWLTGALLLSGVTWTLRHRVHARLV